MNRYVELLIAGLIGAVVALIGAHWVSLAPTPRAATPVEAGVSDAQLRDALEREAIQREMLAADLELMRTVVQHLAAEQVSAAEVESAAESARLADREESNRKEAEEKPRGVQFDEQRLSRIGMVESEIADLRQRWDRAQLAKLDISDRATRGGWLFKPRHGRQMAYVELNLRADIGEDAYDKLLYATNQPNRTEVKQVLGGSAAAHSGIEAGDHILSYGERRIFKPADLRTATASGTRGEQVRVLVERAGTSFSVVVPRGPLGVLMNAKSSAPR
ncbi:MAG: PDZ domain-containing protein [Myxococcota bacterium]|nr:PDZ domain-containing protein [Myxococcota bacterium]